MIVHSHKGYVYEVLPILYFVFSDGVDRIKNHDNYI